MSEVNEKVKNEQSAVDEKPSVSKEAEVKVDGEVKGENGGGEKPPLSNEVETNEAEEQNMSDKDEVDDGESSESSSDDDPNEPEPDGSPEELVKEAKDMLKEEDFSGALNRLSWAIQKKEKSLPPGREYPPELASFFLDYGNALLVKEEHSNELISFSKGPVGETTKILSPSGKKKAAEGTSEASSGSGKASGESSEPAKDASETCEDAKNPDIVDDVITDEQLAWENLEMARICFENKLAEQEKAGDTNLEDVVDATFVNIRLGDMLTLQEKFPEACMEYEAALAMRKKFKLPYPRLQAPTLSLAQAQLFSGETKNALENFRLALTLIENNLEGLDGQVVAEDKKADFEATVEDLKIQILETEKTLFAINEKGSAPVGCPSKDSEGRVRILPEHSAATTSTFDKPQLQGEVFAIPELVGPGPTSETPVKKRRIDLSEVNARMAASHNGAASSS